MHRSLLGNGHQFNKPHYAAKFTPWPPPCDCFLFVFVADISREVFVADAFKGKLSLSTKCIEIDRSRLYQNTIETYSMRPKLVNTIPISVHFEGEEALDFGGVCRDFFSGFWEEAYVKMFDGVAFLTPVYHSDVDMDQFRVLGQILSHGYLCCGFIPTRISFPVLAFILLGLSTSITREILVQSLSELLSLVDHRAVALALKSKEFTPRMRADLINILSRFGCRDVPTPQNLDDLLRSLAEHQFRLQPYAALSAMNGGVPEKHKPFWQAMGVGNLYCLCDALTAKPIKILDQIMEPDFNNPNEQRVFGYLQQYVGNMKLDEAKKFLRFITGSSVLTSDPINVSFNALTGITRRPIAHTCSNMLELPHTYNTFLEFVEEFTALLGSEHCWRMNSL